MLFHELRNGLEWPKARAGNELKILLAGTDDEPGGVVGRASIYSRPSKPGDGLASRFSLLSRTRHGIFFLQHGPRNETFCMTHPFLAFFAPGGGELIVVMLAVLLLFGPKDAPRILRNLQNILNKLKRTAADFQRTLMSTELPDNPLDKSKDTAVYDAEHKPAEEKAPPPPEPPPTDGPKP